MATSSEAFKAFKSTGPIVFIDSKKDGLAKAPKPVAKLRGQSHMGNTIPMVMVTTADLSEGLKGFSYATLESDTRKAVRELKKEIKEMNAVGSASVADEEEEKTSTLLAEERPWTNGDGKTITAAILMADETTVTFLMPGGKTVAYPLAKLSASSQEDVQALLKK